MTAVRSRLGCSWQRNASVLVWTPVLLLGPLLDLSGSGVDVAFQVAVIAVIAASAVAAALTGGPPWRDPRAYVALSTLVAATFAGATHAASSQWLPTWVLLANALAAVLRGRSADGRDPRCRRHVDVGRLVGVATRGRPDVGRGLRGAAGRAGECGLHRRSSTPWPSCAGLGRSWRVWLLTEERERFSRDLHDLLGHTLSVMVVKAQAVRRLVAQDPDAAAEHAADIEQIGRQALVDVRQAVDAMRAPTLAEELDGARRALDAAGIATTVVESVTPSPDADAVLAWVVREGATNVLRHSGASACRIASATWADGSRSPSPTTGSADPPRRRSGPAGSRVCETA